MSTWLYRGGVTLRLGVIATLLGAPSPPPKPETDQPANQSVKIMVRTASGEGVESRIDLRVDGKITKYQTLPDGTVIIRSINCDSETTFRVRPVLRLYVVNGPEWMPCKPQIRTLVRPYNQRAS